MIVILADDLTSALDGAAPFAARGWPASVMLKSGEVASNGAKVLSLDLDTRTLSSADARTRFFEAAHRVRGASVLYKTVDSTLRGHLGVETQATLEAAERHHAVVAPAFPAAGRTTVEGCQFVHGKLVHLTAFARDPRTPVHTSRIQEVMRGLDPTRFTVHDATDDRALDAVIAQLGLRPEVLWVGSPGLGAALARAVPAGNAGGCVSVTMRPAKRVLVMVGSLHPANEAQIAALQQAGVPLLTLAMDTGDPEDEVTAALLEHAFACHPVVGVVSPRVTASDPARPQALALSMGRLARRGAAWFDGLVVTGGDTARRIVDALDASWLDLSGEVEPGVPFGMLHLPDRAIPFSTKAGGFGSAATLLRCVERLRAPQSR